MRYERDREIEMERETERQSERDRERKNNVFVHVKAAPQTARQVVIDIERTRDVSQAVMELSQLLNKCTALIQ